MTTLAAKALELLNSDPPRSARASDPRIAHVPPPIDIELAAHKLLATAAGQGLVLTITQKQRRGAPGHLQTVVSVRPVNVRANRPARGPLETR